MSASAAILGQFQKTLGEHVGVDGLKYTVCPRIPTGIFPLDLALGGGFPLGRPSEIYGMEGSGKTSIALLLGGYVQRVLKKKVVLIEFGSETLDAPWAQKLGVYLKDLIVMRPDTCEQAVDMHEAFLYAEDVGMVLLDSVGALTTENEIEKGADTAAVGGSSALVSKMMRKCGVALSVEAKKGHHPTPIFINQIRHKIGQMHGNPETTPGGNLLRFACHMRVKIYGKDKFLKETDNLPTFKETKGTCVKYKVPIWNKQFEYDMAVRPYAGLKVGQAASWNTVATHLKTAGILVKTDKVQEWTCLGVSVPTLDVLKEMYESDESLRLAMQGEVVKISMVELMPGEPA